MGDIIYCRKYKLKVIDYGCLNLDCIKRVVFVYVGIKFGFEFKWEGRILYF